MTAEFDRYLRLLGIAGPIEGLSGLRKIVQRHLSTVPFENISKLLLKDREGAGRTIGISEFLDGIEFEDLGGTCYTINPFFTELLRALGYDADLLGADMSRPNVHTCIRVRIESAPYHVDVGFAAAFREPIPLLRLPGHMEDGANHYILDKDPYSAGLLMRMSTGGACEMSYIVQDSPRSREFFDNVVMDSFETDATFMNCLRISRVFDTCSLDLIDWKFYRHEAGRTTLTNLETLDELKAVVREQFRMPRCPLESAVAILQRRLTAGSGAHSATSR